MQKADNTIAAQPLEDGRLAYSIDGLAEAIEGAGRSKIYEEIRAGRLKAKKLGSRTIVLAQDAKAYLSQLPDLKGA